MSIDNEKSTEVERRINIAWKKYWSLKIIFKGSCSNKQKCQVFNSCVIPALTYGSQTWSLTRKLEEKVRVTQNAFGRSMLKLRRLDKVAIEEINHKLKFRLNILHQIRRQKWN